MVIVICFMDVNHSFIHSTNMRVMMNQAPCQELGMQWSKNTISTLSGACSLMEEKDINQNFTLTNI